MAIEDDLLRHRRTLDQLRALLEACPEEAWFRPPRPGAWSAAEVYDHIGRIAEGYAFPRLEQCLDGGSGAKGAGPGLLGRFVFWWRSIPGSWRIRAPFPKELLPQALTKEEARALLAHLRAKAEAYAPAVAAADPEARSRHFRLGWLNAAQWFQFVEIHHRHHLEGQLKRLLPTTG